MSYWYLKRPASRSARRREMVKLPKSFWTYAKVSFLAYEVTVAFVTEPISIDSGDTPFWLAIIPVVFLGLFLPLYLRAFVPTQLYLTASPWPAFPFHVFSDPFPFWHLCAWAGIAGAVPQTYHALTAYDHDQMVMALFAWSLGAGALLGITRAKRGLKRNMESV